MRRLWRETLDDRLLDTAAGVAFWAVLAGAIVPSLRESPVRVPEGSTDG